jgi:hypothetical protein
VVDSYRISNPGKKFDKLFTVTDRIAEYLKEVVQADAKAFTIAAGSCISQAIPTNVTGIQSNYDLIILVAPTTSTSLGGRISAGTVCAYDTAFINRPVLGAL